MTTVEDRLVAGTHRGSVLVDDGHGWTKTASFPVPGELTGRYTPLAWLQG